MRFSITFKLFLAIFLTTLALSLGMLVAVRWTFERQFFAYMEERDAGRVRQLGQALTTWYRAAGSWDGLREDGGLWQRLLTAPAGGATGPAGPIDALPLPAVTLLDARSRRVAGPTVPAAASPRYPLEVDGATVGWLVVPMPHLLRSAADHRVQREQTETIWVIAALCALLAALASVVLARGFLAPVRRLARAMEHLSAGAYDTRVPANAKDEFGRLARHFNRLAHTLERTQASRLQMVADVSHELRTPLAVLRGEIEAVLNGVRPLARAALVSLHDEVILLTKLVGDLYELALADADALSYRMAPVELRALAARIIAGQQGRFRAAGLSISLDAPAAGVIQGDAQRLTQLLTNVLENALRYTNAGGEVRISVLVGPAHVTVRCDDSPPGVPADLLPRLFDRLFRVNASRGGRGHGGAGLGLALCERIVAAHQGSIRALPSALGGVCIQMEFARDPEAVGGLSEQS